MKHDSTNLTDEPLDRDTLFRDCTTLVRDAEIDADVAEEWDEWTDDDIPRGWSHAG
jgi:hypothetical protein